MSTGTIDISSLHEVYTDRSIAEEATRPETVRKGNYSGTVVSVELRPAGDKSPFPGRTMGNIRVALDVDGKTITKFVEVSHEEYRRGEIAGEKFTCKPGDATYSKEYPLDGPSKLWGMIEKLVNKDGNKSVGELYADLPDRKFRFYVSEPFVDEDGGYHSYKDEEGRTALVKAGYTPKNFINSITAVKE